MDWFVLNFFIKNFLGGFIVGIIIRLIIAIIFKTDLTPGGLFRTALVIAIGWILMIVYLLWRM